MPSIKGASVVVTGASSGIGRATALAFARRGARLVLASRRGDVLDDLVEECRAAGGHAIAVPTDMTIPAEVSALARAAEEAYGGVDVWVNNAGSGVLGLFWEAPVELHRRTIELNLLGAVHGAAEALPIFLRQNRGTLINTISLVGWAPAPFGSSYTASKFGLRGFSAALRQELVGHPAIRVCGVFPALVDTPVLVNGANMTGKEIGLGPFVYRAEDVAETILSVARHPRDEVAVGWPSRAAQMMHGIAPWLTENLIGLIMRQGIRSLPPGRRTEGALLEPSWRGTSTSGGWLQSRNQPSARSMTQVALGAAALIAGTALLAAIERPSFARKPRARYAPMRLASYLQPQRRRSFW